MLAVPFKASASETSAQKEEAGCVWRTDYESYNWRWKKSKLRSGDVVGAISSIDGVDGKTDIGAIDIRESITYVEILNGKGALVLEELPKRTMKENTERFIRQEKG